MQNGIVTPRMPATIRSVPITRLQQEGWELFKFTHWQGVAWSARLHALGQVLNSVFWAVTFLSIAIEGNAAVIFGALILVPIMWLIWAAMIRVACEVAVAVLLVPMLVANQQELAGDGVVVSSAEVDVGGFEVQPMGASNVV